MTKRGPWVDAAVFVLAWKLSLEIFAYYAIDLETAVALACVVALVPTCIVASMGARRHGR